MFANVLCIVNFKQNMLYLQHNISLKVCGIYVANMGLVLLHLRIMLVVGMSWADMLSVMLARGVMCDARYTRQEEAF